MTEFVMTHHDDEFQPFLGTAGAIAPAPVEPELQIGVGALLGRLSAADAA